MRITPALHLVCKACGWRPGANQTMAEVKQHMVAAHGTENVVLDLSAFCACGGEMRLKFTEPMGDGFRDHYICPRCGNEGWVERTK